MCLYVYIYFVLMHMCRRVGGCDNVKYSEALACFTPVYYRLLSFFFQYSSFQRVFIFIYILRLLYWEEHSFREVISKVGGAVS